MAKSTQILGSLPVIRGEYDSNELYYKDNIVLYRRAAYYCKVDGPITNSTPNRNSTNWGIFSGIDINITDSMDSLLDKNATLNAINEFSERTLNDSKTYADSRITTVNSEIATINNNITDCNTSLDNLRTTINENKEALSNKIIDTSTKLHEYADNIKDSIDVNISDLNTDISTYKNTINSNIKALENKDISLYNKLEESNEKFETLNTYINDVVTSKLNDLLEKVVEPEVIKTIKDDVKYVYDEIANEIRYKLNSLYDLNIEEELNLKTYNSDFDNHVKNECIHVPGINNNEWKQGMVLTIDIFGRVEWKDVNKLISLS